MTWDTFRVADLDWLNPEEAGGKQELSETLDPYAVWACLTQFRGYSNQPEFRHSNPAETSIPVICQAGKVGLSAASEPWIHIPPVYTAGTDRAVEANQFFTARVALRDLPKLRDRSKFALWELGLPGVAGGSGMLTGPAMLASNGPRDVPAHAHPPAKPDAVIGVIDYGCAFLNAQFRHGTGSRVCRIWDQGSAVGAEEREWQRPARFGYGRELLRDKIDARVTQLEEKDELEIYRELGYLLTDDDDKSSPIRATTHGTHVLDVAAGRFDPLTGRTDHASEAQIVFVQLPLLTASDSSGGSLGVHVLDAVRYILDASGDNARIVINLSYGTLAGPHDGSTLLERAMDDLLSKRRDNFAIVLASGNERELRGHIAAEVGPERPLVLRWSVMATDTTDSFLEIWYPDGAQGSLEVQVKAPGGMPCAPVASGGRRRLNAPNGRCIAAVMHEKHVPNGAGPMILVAQSPTQTANGAAELEANASAGTWEVTLTNRGEPVEVQAWIERDDPSALGPRRQSVFEGAVTEQGTLNTYATGKYPIAVGGCRRSDGSPLRYSGIGPTRSGEARPHVLAACEENEALEGIRATAVRSDEPHRMNGTSVAAPVLARQLFNEITERGTIGRTAWDQVLQDLAHRESTRDVVRTIQEAVADPQAMTARGQPAGGVSSDTMTDMPKQAPVRGTRLADWLYPRAKAGTPPLTTALAADEAT